MAHLERARRSSSWSKWPSDSAPPNEMGAAVMSIGLAIVTARGSLRQRYIHIPRNGAASEQDQKSKIHKKNQNQNQSKTKGKGKGKQRQSAVQVHHDMPGCAAERHELYRIRISLPASRS